MSKQGFPQREPNPWGYAPPAPTEARPRALRLFFPPKPSLPSKSSKEHAAPRFRRPTRRGVRSNQGRAIAQGATADAQSAPAKSRPPPTLSDLRGKRPPPQAMGRAATKPRPRSLAARDARGNTEHKKPQGRMLRSFYSVALSQDAERASLHRMKTHSFLESCKVWGTFGAHFGAQTKKARAHKALTWRFNGAGDGNRTRVRSLEGFSSTIEPHPHMVGTTGFEPATSCSQSRRATKLRHVPSTVQLGYYNKARRMFKKISLNSRALESPPKIQPPRE